MDKGFWVKFNLKNGLSIDETNKVLDYYYGYMIARHCSSTGGIGKSWDWEELVHGSRKKVNITESDREAAINYLENSDIIMEYEVGDLIDLEDAEYESVEKAKKSIIEHFTKEDDS